uniref:Uncharacterized protein n=1 Tax=Crocodylus porosus TaxID=8502 RepID=A0A7M4EY50_CROPO
ALVKFPSPPFSSSQETMGSGLGSRCSGKTVMPSGQLFPSTMPQAWKSVPSLAAVSQLYALIGQLGLWAGKVSHPLQLFPSPLLRSASAAVASDVEVPICLLPCLPSLRELCWGIA